MKKFFFRFCMMFCFSLLIVSCNWSELEEYNDAEISSVQLYYRWGGNSKDPITGEPIMREQRLSTNCKVNSALQRIEVKVIVPEANGEFSETVRKDVSINKLWGQVTISTASRIFPIDGSPKLGTPGDWSKENYYDVVAADGTKKSWSIKIVSFDK